MEKYQNQHIRQEYLLPVIAMSIAVPDMIMEVLKFMKKKK